MDFPGGSLTARRLRSLRSLMVVNGSIGLVLVGASLTYDPSPPRAGLRWASVIAVFVGLALVVTWADRSLARGAIWSRLVPAAAVALGALTCVASVTLSSAYAADTLAFPVELMPASAVVVMGAWALLFTRSAPTPRGGPVRPRTRVPGSGAGAPVRAVRAPARVSAGRG